MPHWISAAMKWAKKASAASGNFGTVPCKYVVKATALISDDSNALPNRPSRGTSPHKLKNSPTVMTSMSGSTILFEMI